MDSRVIHLRFEAPAKPAEHAPCNGCGVCCAAEPCPVGVLVSGRRRGACAALQWSDDGARYRCGLVSAPRSVLPWLPESMVPVVRRAVLRWIAAASGCDSSLLADAGRA